MTAPVFFLDFNSPYAYLAAHRVDDVLPVSATWRPIAFGALIGQVGKTPWSIDPETRADGQRDCETRAAALGLPLHWPAGWPIANYSIPALRAAVVAERAGRLEPYALELFARNFGTGEALQDPAVLAAAAEAVEVDGPDVLAGLEDPGVKALLRSRTDEAVAAGVTGVPTVLLADGRSFWGDDRLEEVAAALAG